MMDWEEGLYARRRIRVDIRKRGFSPDKTRWVSVEPGMYVEGVESETPQVERRVGDLEISIRGQLLSTCQISYSRLINGRV